ncbi:MAG: cache domain-containing protein [Magnetospirillum sp.]|nr:cache domain-containing protein [Magnetospirillum sp.]
MFSLALQDRSERRASLLAGVLLLLLTIAAAATFVLIAEDKNARTRLDRDLRHRADLHEAYIRANVLTIDQALQALRAQIVDEGVPPDLRAWVAARGMLREPLFQFAVADRQGRLVASSEFGSNTGIDLSDRRHIRVHLDGNADRIYFSEPLVGRASGRLSINVTRPVFEGDEKVGGVVVASVNPRFFSAYLQDFSFPGEYVAKLVGSGGGIRARSDQENANPGGSIKDPALLEQLMSRAAGVMLASFGTEGRRHLVAYRPVEGYDLYVTVGVDAAYLEAEASAQRQTIIGFTLLTALLVVAMGIAYDRIASINAEASALRARSEERETQIRKMGSLLSDCDAIMLRVDANGRILDANPAFRAVFGTLPGVDDVAALVAKAVAAPRFPFRTSGYAKDAHGTRREFIWSWIKLPNEDAHREEFLGVAVDHTEIRQQELMLIHASKLASLGRQSASICHELAQPLNVVSLGLDNLRRDVLADGPLESKLKRLDRLTANVRRAGKILDRFRALARAPSRPLEVLLLRMTVLAAVDAMADPFHLEDIRVEFRATADPVVRANALELEQVFVNILTNAKDAIVGRAGGAGPRLVVVSLDLSSDGKSAEVGFRDNGGGLPEELLRFGVRPFSSTKEAQGGIGLGLAISDATIRSLGGELRFENVEGGAMFTVSIPIQHAVSAPEEIKCL